MPVEYCPCCRTMRAMNLATSRVQVVSTRGSTAEITTRTYCCTSCRSFLFESDRDPKGSSDIPRRRRGPAASSRRLALCRMDAGARIMQLVTLLAFLLLACQTVPITERRQLSLIPTETILPLSFGNYREFLAKHQVIENTEEARMVKRAGSRIAQAVERYFAEHGLSKELEGYAWEFNLIEDRSVNAWAMPGGKVVIYSGILPVTLSEGGLAVVMGHEIAHAVANHGDERMSQGLLAQMGGLALTAALARRPRETNDLFLAAYGLGAQVGVLLPFSRLQESEADHLGLIFMAMAGYDPRGAVDFWKRMAQAKQGPSPPEFLSTHPADEKRIGNIRELLPEAMRYYKT